MNKLKKMAGYYAWNDTHSYLLQAFCQTRGSHLIHIDDNEEVDFLKIYLADIASKTILFCLRCVQRFRMSYSKYPQRTLERNYGNVCLFNIN